MTTIAYRNGILAADSRAYGGDRHPIGQKTKIFRLTNGDLVGCSTTQVGVANKFLRLLEGLNGDYDDIDEDWPLQALLVRKNGEVFLWSDGNSFTGPLEADFWAIGSGEQYAWGALWMGASAEEALECACVGDVFSAKPIHILKLPGFRKSRKR